MNVIPTQESQTIDYKVTKRHYPRTNNGSVLEFVFEKDPNLFLRKNKILIRGHIELHPDFMVQKGWASKLFSQMTVEVNSQAVSKNNNRFFVFVFN